MTATLTPIWDPTLAYPVADLSPVWDPGLDYPIAWLTPHWDPSADYPLAMLTPVWGWPPIVRGPRILYDNRLTDAPLVASTTAAGEFAAPFAIDGSVYTWWQPATMPATLTVDCGAEASADYALLLGHNLGSLGVTVEVRGSSDGFVAHDQLLAQQLVPDDGPLLLLFPEEAYRHWRLRFTGATAPAMAHAAIGRALVLPTGMAAGFDPVGVTVDSQRNRNECGHSLGLVLHGEERAQTLRLNRVPRDWLTGAFLPAWRAHLNARPFAFAWDPHDHPDEVALVVADGPVTTPHYAGATVDLDLPVVGWLQ